MKDLTEPIQNSVQNTNAKKILQKNNSAQNTYVTNNLTEHVQNSARDTNVPNNQADHMQNSAQDTNVTNSQQNTYKTVHKAKRNKLSRKLIPNSAQGTSVTNRQQNTCKPLCEALK